MTKIFLKILLSNLFRTSRISCQRWWKRPSRNVNLLMTRQLVVKHFPSSKLLKSYLCKNLNYIWLWIVLLFFDWIIFDFDIWFKICLKIYL